MNKLSKKFIVGIVVILILSSFCSILFNTQFIEHFYLYQKKNDITKIANEFTTLLQQEYPVNTAIEQMEATYKLMIVPIEYDINTNNDEINNHIQRAFQEKGIGFQKYWFWEEDYKKVLDGNSQIRLYQQEKLKYSLLISYIQIDTSLYAITMIIPNVADAFKIANNFLIVVSITTIIMAILFIMLLIKKITKPLHQFDQFAKHMKDNEFTPIEVHSNDELEKVANNLNDMGSKIIHYQTSLQDKNLQMEQLLDNVAHDLKTPIALIQLYTEGMKDGIDDGTFLDTILDENKRMSDMINRLLFLSQIEKKQNKCQTIHVSKLLQQLIHKYGILAKENQIEFQTSLENDVCLFGEEELLVTLFSNLLTNAIKYSSGNVIHMQLIRQNKNVIFTIINETDLEILNLEDIWKPYYVGEQSRNKKLSGTGLGLCIVQKICETQHYEIQCTYNNHKIIFNVFMPL